MRSADQADTFTEKKLLCLVRVQNHFVKSFSMTIRE